MNKQFTNEAGMRLVYPELIIDENRKQIRRTIMGEQR
jgi:hypothetical protein